MYEDYSSLFGGMRVAGQSNKLGRMISLPRLNRRVVCHAVILLCALWARPLHAGYMHASGVTVVDNENDQIVLRGVDLGC